MSGINFVDMVPDKIDTSMGRMQPKAILWLNDTFNIHRNEEAIDRLHQKAHDYDRDLETISDRLIQEKLKLKKSQSKI